MGIFMLSYSVLVTAVYVFNKNPIFHEVTKRDFKTDQQNPEMLRNHFQFRLLVGRACFSDIKEYLVIFLNVTISTTIEVREEINTDFECSTCFKCYDVYFTKCQIFCGQLQSIVGRTIIQWSKVQGTTPPPAENFRNAGRITK